MQTITDTPKPSIMPYTFAPAHKKAGVTEDDMPMSIRPDYLSPSALLL